MGALNERKKGIKLPVMYYKPELQELKIDKVTISITLMVIYKLLSVCRVSWSPV